MHLLELEFHLLFNIFSYLEDVDLQITQRVCSAFCILSLDPVLKRHILMSRNATRIEKNLFFAECQRPSRLQLYERNILKGVTKEMLTQGRYINSEHTILRNRLETQVYRNHRHQFLQAMLQSWLSNNVQPQRKQVATQISPKLLSSALALDACMKKDKLKQKLAHRISLDSLISRGIWKASCNSLPTQHEHCVHAVEILPDIRLSHTNRIAAIKTLNHSLQRRSSLEELVDRGIYKASTISSPRIIPKQLDLAKEMGKDALKRKMQERPKASKLILEGILKASLLYHAF